MTLHFKYRAVPQGDGKRWNFRQGNEAYRFNVPINIILKPGDFPVLLGQEGFFDRFIITFDRKEESFWIKKKGGLFS